MPEALAQLTAAWTASQRAKSVNTSAWGCTQSRGGWRKYFSDAAGNRLWLDRADSLMRSVDDPQGRIEVLSMRARQAQRAGDLATTERLLREAQQTADKLGRTWGARVHYRCTLRTGDGSITSSTRLRRSRRSVARWWIGINSRVSSRHSKQKMPRSRCVAGNRQGVGVARCSGGRGTSQSKEVSVRSRRGTCSGLRATW